jgi:hypothetical protein
LSDRFAWSVFTALGRERWDRNLATVASGNQRLFNYRNLAVADFFVPHVGLSRAGHAGSRNLHRRLDAASGWNRGVHLCDSDRISNRHLDSMQCGTRVLGGNAFDSGRLPLARLVVRGKLRRSGASDLTVAFAADRLRCARRSRDLYGIRRVVARSTGSNGQLYA